MGQGIVIKVWNVKEGSRGRSGAAQIRDSINYIANEEKTKCQVPVASGQIARELNYIANDVKTMQGLYVGTRNIVDPAKATKEMIQVKEYFGKLGGRVAFHGVISLDESESDPKNAGKLMMLMDELLKELFPDNQAVYAIHTNTDNLHVHFVVNTVGLDGKKIHMDKGFMRHRMEPALNRLAEKYGFTPNQEWKKQNRPDPMPVMERKMRLRRAIDLAIEEEENFEDFLKNLRKRGYRVNVGKYLSLQSEDMPRAMRSFRLGKGYTIDMIAERIRRKRDAFEHLKIDGIELPEGRDLISFQKNLLKKYKDMTPEEKQHAVRLLRMGKNPWRMRSQTNWQVDRISEELSGLAHTDEIIRTFAPHTGTVAEAKQGILDRRLKIRDEKQKVRELMRRYQPIFQLYEEAREHEQKAYLYEATFGHFGQKSEKDTIGHSGQKSEEATIGHSGQRPEKDTIGHSGQKSEEDTIGHSGQRSDWIRRFHEDYVAWQEFEKRAEKAYGKTLPEIAAMKEELESQLLYLREQDKALYAEYRRLIREEEKDQIPFFVPKQEGNLWEVIGHGAAVKQAREYSIFSERHVFITSKTSREAYLEVITLPSMQGGKPTISTKVIVKNSSGEEIDRFSSEELSRQAFNKRLRWVRSTFHMEECEAIRTEDEAKRKMTRRQVRS
jgi:hypothetical protein